MYFIDVFEKHYSISKIKVKSIMNYFKELSEILSSITSIIAILMLGTQLIKFRQKPLSIKRIVIHTSDTKNNKYFIEFRNGKNYPVTIKTLKGYTKRPFRVEMLDNNRPSMYPFWDYENCFINVKPDVTIEENGCNTVTLEALEQKMPDDYALFSIQTSHGYHSLSCKNITVVQIGKSKCHRVVFSEEINNKTLAWLRFLFLFLVYGKNKLVCFFHTLKSRIKPIL